MDYTRLTPDLRQGPRPLNRQGDMGISYILDGDIEHNTSNESWHPELLTDINDTLLHMNERNKMISKRI